MTVHLTPTQARRLGLGVKVPRQTRRTLPGPYASTCHTCGLRFASRAAEDRHVEETKHARYEVEL